MHAETVNSNKTLHWGANLSLWLLIILGIAWEMALAPLKPGGSFLVLKVVPLLLPLRGVWRGNLYTLQWAAMLVLLYFMEGVVRAWSDISATSAILAGIEVVFAVTFYLCAILTLRPAKRAAKARQQESR